MPQSKSIFTDSYQADPRAHVFNGRVYIYPSHDIDAGVPEDDEGGHFDMRDYHVLSLDDLPNGKVTDSGPVLKIGDVPWAKRQLWSNDCAEKDGTYYMYFPAKDAKDTFYIGVATSKKPDGPFVAEPKPIEGSFGIDPCAFKDSDGQYYLYFGGLWGGQLQRWRTGTYNPNEPRDPTDNGPALGPKIAKLSADMKSFAEPVRTIKILDQDGKELLQQDRNRRFFEACWMHKYNGKYYLSYSTGDTHLLVYATGDNPYGPFTYQGVILTPVVGWTTHHSILEYKGKWWLFYHDSTVSGGKTHLRSPKIAELKYNPDGTIVTLDGMR